MKGNGWKTFQIVQFIVFLCFSVFLFVRAVDGHGAAQTLEAKLISFAVWGIFYLGVLAVEWLIYAIVRRSKKQDSGSMERNERTRMAGWRCSSPSARLRARSSVCYPA